MKRQKRRTKSTQTRKTQSPSRANSSESKTSRREFLAGLRNKALLVAAVGGGGWFVVREVSATNREHDLSRIGNGIPAVVQIHDPQCPSCIALQRETRKALSGFDDEKLQFLVANIRQSKGRQLAAAHGVGHVTLLLFDGAGQRRDVLVGNNSSEYLEQVFREHLVESGAS